jgi:uncharacterized protein with ATP-grasp and redox domains
MVDDRKYRDYYLQAERTAEQRRKDLVVAFDEIHDVKCKYRNLKTFLKVVVSANVIGLAVIGWLATHLYDCVTAATAVAR